MNSDLNPEAPEFYPHLTSVTQGGYKTVHKSIISSNQLPHGTSFDNYKTFTNFNVVTCQLRENVVVQANQIIAKELPTMKLKLNDHDHNMDKLSEANDGLLDRVNIGVDALVAPTGAAAPPAAAPPAPVIAKIQVGSTTFIGAKNIPRPQLMFKEPVDNSDAPWVPRLREKPHARTPLALRVVYDAAGEPAGYEHPYRAELEAWRPSAALLAADAAPELPPPPERTPLTLVETPDQVDALVAHLATQPELAVDLEHHSYRTYQGITCLMQISTPEGGDFVVDALAARDHLHKLNHAFTDPDKLKVFHGADSDVLWLQRDFGLYVVGMFDTHRAARLLRRPQLGLKALLHHYCAVVADKKFQLADWRIRPLPAELVAYARLDTHYLLYVWRRMRADLRAAAHGADDLLRAAFDDSRRVCLQTYSKERVGPESHLALYVRSRKAFDARQLAALKLLYKWRDAHARDLDESTQYLLPNHMLVALAEQLPRELQGVHALCCPMPPFVKQHVVTIHRMLLSCREIPLEPQLHRAAPAAAAPAPRAPALRDLHDRTQPPPPADSACTPAGAQATARAGGGASDVPLLSAPAPPRRPAPRHPRRPRPPHLLRHASAHGVSALKGDTKLFIPPYNRYKNYRTLAQIEELKEFKAKEARIAAIGKGNELIKTEVLMQLQRAVADAPAPAPAASPAASPPAHEFTPAAARAAAAAPADPAPAPAAAPAPPRRRERVKAAAASRRAPARERARPEPAAHNTKMFYKNVDYKKFYNATEKKLKQPKMKNKKHK